MSTARHVVVVGLMGSGKTTVGRALAEALGRDFVDNDDQVQEMTGLDARHLQATRGQDALHDVEATALGRALADPAPSVIAAAASVVERADARDRLSKHAWVVWLDVPSETLAARVAGSDAHRPEGTDIDALRDQRRRRGPLLTEVADAVVAADRSVEGVTAEVVRLARLGARRATVDDGSPHGTDG